MLCLVATPAVQSILRRRLQKILATLPGRKLHHLAGRGGARARHGAGADPSECAADYAALLATARIPTLMEKPLERSHAGAQAVAELYAQARVPLGLCFQHRTRTAARCLKQKLETGALGEIVHVGIRVPWWRDQAY